VTDWDTVCHLASDLPGATLTDDNTGGAAWRVNGKVLIRRYPHLGDQATDEEVVAIRTTLLEREALIAESPHTYFLTPHWSKSRNTSILVRLATADETQLRELITEAWRARAKRAQVAEWSRRSAG
jgi:hypothetical protein